MKLAKILLVTSLVAGAGSALAGIKVAPNPYHQPGPAFNYVYKIVVKQNEGDRWAQYLLAKYYQTGYGTSVDKQEAYVWYKMSLDGDYKPAKSALEKLKSQMTNRELAQAQKAFIATRNESVERELAEIKKAMTS